MRHICRQEPIKLSYNTQTDRPTVYFGTKTRSGKFWKRQKIHENLNARNVQVQRKISQLPTADSYRFSNCGGTFKMMQWKNKDALRRGGVWIKWDRQLFLRSHHLWWWEQNNLMREMIIKNSTFFNRRRWRGNKDEPKGDCGLNSLLLQWRTKCLGDNLIGKLLRRKRADASLAAGNTWATQWNRDFSYFPK